MSSAFAIDETESNSSLSLPSQPASSRFRVHAFSRGHQDEVLAFLAGRPIYTVFMSGLIRDNGLVSFANRGTFYGCRDRDERLTGVVLIGSKTIIEAHDDATLDVMARLIPNNLTSHLVRGEQQQIEYVIDQYAAIGRKPRQICKELLLEQTAPAAGVLAAPELRLAHAEDLDAVVSINAALAYEESGLNPLLNDARGMWARTARRIDQGRVWNLVEQGELIFKGDIISETPQTVFVEGVYVQPHARRKGYGLRCMTQLACNLLGRYASICLVVNEDNLRGRRFYEKLGYEVRSDYSTAYFSAV